MMSQLGLPVEEFTTPNPFTVVEETPISELNRIMSEEGFRHLPVMRGERVVGIVSERDLRVASGLSLLEKMLVHAGDIMVSDPVTVSSEDSIEEVAFIMSQNKIGSVIVNDMNDKFLGIFTVTDALNALIEVSRLPQKEI